MDRTGGPRPCPHCPAIGRQVVDVARFEDLQRPAWPLAAVVAPAAGRRHPTARASVGLSRPAAAAAAAAAAGGAGGFRAGRD